jgi:hypothetical protein
LVKRESKRAKPLGLQNSKTMIQISSVNQVSHPMLLRPIHKKRITTENGPTM